MTAKERPDMLRRGIVKAGLAAGTFAMLGGLKVFTADAPKSQIWTITGQDKAQMMATAMEIIQSNGGFGRAVNTLALKVNAAWARTPEQGANTHPELVAAFLDGCRKAGISKISIPEFPCDSYRESFMKSGIYDAVSKKGFALKPVNGSSKCFSSVDVPSGRSLSKVDIVEDFLNADAVVNMPVVKSHSSGGVSIAMKNWMGSVRDRGYWHGHNLHQCIADFATVFKPTWAIIDATRVMLDSGPKGPSRNTKKADMIILSKDQLAADAYATRLFWGNTKKAKFLEIAASMGLGSIDPESMDVRKVSV